MSVPSQPPADGLKMRGRPPTAWANLNFDPNDEVLTEAAVPIDEGDGTQRLPRAPKEGVTVFPVVNEIGSSIVKLITRNEAQPTATDAPPGSSLNRRNTLESPEQDSGGLRFVPHTGPLLQTLFNDHNEASLAPSPPTTLITRPLPTIAARSASPDDAATLGNAMSHTIPTPQQQATAPASSPTSSQLEPVIEAPQPEPSLQTGDKTVLKYQDLPIDIDGPDGIQYSDANGGHVPDIPQRWGAQDHVPDVLQDWKAYYEVLPQKYYDGDGEGEDLVPLRTEAGGDAEVMTHQGGETYGLPGRLLPRWYASPLDVSTPPGVHENLMLSRDVGHSRAEAGVVLAVVGSILFVMGVAGCLLGGLVGKRRAAMAREGMERVGHLRRDV